MHIVGLGLGSCGQQPMSGTFHAPVGETWKERFSKILMSCEV